MSLSAVVKPKLVRSTAEDGHATLIIEVAGTFVFSAYWLIKGFESRSTLRAGGQIPQTSD